MAASTTPNADLEQSLFKAKQKESRLRFRAILAAIVPVLAGGGWLYYSLAEVTTWQANAEETENHQKELEQRETAARKAVIEADNKRVAAEESAKQAIEKAGDAERHSEEVQKHIIKVREEIGALNPLLNDLNGAKLKASRLMASEAVESQITEIRNTLGHSLDRIGKVIDKDLPPRELKPRVYFFVIDDQQRAEAAALIPAFQSAGYEVPAIGKNTTRRVDVTEVRYFHEPEDKAEAQRIQELLATQGGRADGKVLRTSDPDHSGGSRSFEVWLGKSPQPAPR